jgi:hypothetical protein
MVFSTVRDAVFSAVGNALLKLEFVISDKSWVTTILAYLSSHCTDCLLFIGHHVL